MVELKNCKGIYCISKEFTVFRMFFSLPPPVYEAKQEEKEKKTELVLAEFVSLLMRR